MQKTINYQLQPTNLKKGFTLIELSVVLVILAVLVGGIITGQSLIQTAQLNGLIGDVERYKSAFSRFQVEYQQLPGDMDNAYDYWGSKCGTNSSNCNGNGTSTLSQGEEEGLLFWNHLYVSDLVDDYSEPISNREALCDQGVNMPYTAMDSVSMLPRYNSIDARSATVNEIINIIFVFSLIDEANDQSGCISYQDAFSAEQLYTIDKKMDDGFAYSGKVLNSQNNTGCTTSSNADASDLDDGDYDLANNGTNLCKLYVVPKID